MTNLSAITSPMDDSASAQNDISESDCSGSNYQVHSPYRAMENPIYVTGAKVSCRTRHEDNRHDRVVKIEKTQLNRAYGGPQAARNKVRTALNKQGFNSTFVIHEWVH